MARPGASTRVVAARDFIAGLGGVGQRMLAAATRKLAGEFFTAVDRQLGEGSGAIDTPATGTAPATAAAGPVDLTATTGARRGPQPAKRPLELGKPMLLLAAAALGAFIALGGVVIRWRLRDPVGGGPVAVIVDVR